MKRLLLPCLLAALLSGCRYYTIDSNPQGLRVVINDIEHGDTPTSYFCWASDGFDLVVYPPANAQWDAYERDGKRIVSTFIDEPQGKYIKGERSPSGTILFDFVTSEYPRPDTPEGWTLLRESLRADAATTTRRTRLHTFPD